MMYSLHNDLVLSHHFATDEHMYSARSSVDFMREMRSMQNSMFDARNEIDFMGVYPNSQAYMRSVYIPIEDCPVSDLTEFYKYNIIKGKGCIFTNQGNIMAYRVPGAKKPPEVMYRFVKAIIPKTIEFYLSGHLFRYVPDGDRNMLGYFNRFKF